MKSFATATVALALSASAVKFEAISAQVDPAYEQALAQAEAEKFGKNFKKYKNKAKDFLKKLNPLSADSIVNIKGLEPKSQLHKLMTGFTTDGIVTTLLSDQLADVDPAIVDEIKAQSLSVATSSVMHCVDGGDIAMLALNHTNGDDPASMFFELVDGKENCMANFLVKEAERSLAMHSDILDDIPESWQ